MRRPETTTGASLRVVEVYRAGPGLFAALAQETRGGGWVYGYLQGDGRLDWHWGVANERRAREAFESYRAGGPLVTRLEMAWGVVEVERDGDLEITLHDDGSATLRHRFGRGRLGPAQRWSEEHVTAAVAAARVCIESRGPRAVACDCTCCQIAVAVWAARRAA